MVFDLIGRPRPSLSFADAAGGGGGEGGGGGGGGSGDADAAEKKAKEEFEARVKTRVEEETVSVRAHRDATIEEKRTLKTKYDEVKKTIDDLGGQEGVERLEKLRSTLAKDELGKLLAEGPTRSCTALRIGATFPSAPSRSTTSTSSWSSARCVTRYWRTWGCTSIAEVSS